MNKKLLFGLFAACSMLFATSCSQEEPAANLGNEGIVTFKVKHDAPRAFGNAFGVNQLVWEVYDVYGNKLPAPLSGQKAAFEDGSLTTTVEFKLAKGQTYSFAFFAYNTASGNAYNTSDLKNIKISYEGITSNLEDRDAFFGNVINYTVEGNFEKEVVLKRPFAQLNFGVTKEDWADAVAAGITVAQSEIVIDEVAGIFSALDGTVSGALKNVKFALANLPAEDLLVDFDGDGTKEAYKYLSMNYILANDASTGYNSTSNKVDFNFTTNAANIAITSDNTPLQRNWRTNIIGSLINTGTFKIVIDTVFAGEVDSILGGELKVYNVTNKTTALRYETIEAAIAAANQGDVIELAAGEYTLASALDLTNGVTIQSATGAAQDVVFNGVVNLKSGTLKNVTLKQGVADGSLMTSALHGDCTVEGVIFNCPTTGTVNAFKEYSSWGDGKKHNLTFKNCVIKANGQRPFQFDITDALVEGCTINNPYRYCVQLGDYAKGCTLTFKNNNVVKYGSTNKEFYCYVQIADADDANNVVVLSGNTQDGSVDEKWQDFVVENTTSNVQITFAEGVAYQNGAYEISSAKGMFWLANQVNKQNNKFTGQTVRLTADIDLENQLWEPIGQETGGQEYKFFGTFDGNNKTIKNLKIDMDYSQDTYACAGLFGWTYDIKVKDLTIDGASIHGHHYVGAVVAYLYGTVENCTVKNAKVSSTWGDNDNDGDKAGSVVGLAATDGGSMNNCHAIDCQVDAVRDAGQVVGAALGSRITSCTATRVTVSHNDSAPADYQKNGENITEGIIGKTY